MSALAQTARRFWPQRLRTRLAVFYALVIFVVGVALLAVSYVLVVKLLVPAVSPSPKSLTTAQNKLLGLCKPPPTSEPLVRECDKLIGQLGNGPEARGDALAKLQWGTGIGLVVMVFVSAGLGWLVSGRALRPVRSITEAARVASELRLGQRLALSGPDDELKQLADTFDVMLERLDAAFTSQKRFVANAAHELRTPLTLMRTAVEVTLAKPERTPEQLEAMAAEVMRSVTRAEATVEALLTLATSELGPAAQQTVDLATAAEDALDDARGSIVERGLTVESSLDPALVIGDRVLLERMIANLVENAVRHNQRDGWIAVRTLQREDGAVFEITNTGPEVPAASIPSLFEPFARAEGRLNGAGVGLGLSIAHTIALAHNATIDARARPGGGLEIAVSVPADSS